MLLVFLLTPPPPLQCPPSWVELDFLSLAVDDLMTVTVPFQFTATVPTQVHGVALWFDVVFAGSKTPVFLSTGPHSAPTHWYQTRCLWPKPLFVGAGRTLEGTAVFRANGKQSYFVELKGAIRGTQLAVENVIDLKGGWPRACLFLLFLPHNLQPLPPAPPPLRQSPSFVSARTAAARWRRARTSTLDSDKQTWAPLAPLAASRTLATLRSR